LKTDKFSFVLDALCMRFAYARYFLSCVNSSNYQTFEFWHDRLFEIDWFDISIHTSRSNCALSFRLFEEGFLINRVIRVLMLEWLSLKYWLYLFQFTFWVLNFSIIELFIVLAFSISIENSMTSWSDSISASSLINQHVIFDAMLNVANVKSIIELEFYV
jgi:hypothetical protein